MPIVVESVPYNFFKYWLKIFSFLFIIL
jgi:hypothetical protein